jgi:hypothetical protein
LECTGSLNLLGRRLLQGVRTARSTATGSLPQLSMPTLLP